MNNMNWETIRQINLVDYLAFLGHHPDIKMSRNQEYWYLSPLPGRNEKTPSFKIDRRKNLWYDHGLGKGGSIIDFCMLYHGCGIIKVLDKLRDFFSFHGTPFQSLMVPEISGHAPNPTIQFFNEKKKIRVLATGPIVSPALINYLEQRKIPVGIAQNYCKEAQYELNNRKYYAIGFLNDAGGYELRNAHFKGSAAPKSFTFFNNGAGQVCVFEGVFDFLSYVTIQKNGINNTNILVLNSLAYLEKARPLMEQHSSIYLYLDRDHAGKSHTIQLANENSKYKDHSLLYDGYADLNEWLTKKTFSLHRLDLANDEEGNRSGPKRNFGLGR
ncbi:toprim domain-containing protein [Niabella hirudinis]|uniref:toprim domain-containing protein n=1 Tax=Niabella hirudinis TaxID=1285929 RepID=UPI003EBB1519